MSTKSDRVMVTCTLTTHRQLLEAMSRVASPSSLRSTETCSACGSRARLKESPVGAEELAARSVNTHCPLASRWRYAVCARTAVPDSSTANTAAPVSQREAVWPPCTLRAADRALAAAGRRHRALRLHSHFVGLLVGVIDAIAFGVELEETVRVLDAEVAVARVLARRLALT